MGHLATNIALCRRGCASTGEREVGGHRAGTRDPDQAWRHDLPLPTRLSSVSEDGEGQQTQGDRWGTLQKHWNKGSTVRLCLQ